MPQTGPRTRAGKAKARLNALTHGLRSTVAPIFRNIENVKDYRQHIEAVVASLDTEGYLEDEMAVRVGEILWRLRRVALYEAELVNVAIDHMPIDMAVAAEYGEKVTGVPRKESFTRERIEMQGGIRMLPDRHSLAKITRYEAHLHRQYIQTLHELEAMQLRRNGGHAPLARLDITGAPQSG